MASSGNQVDRAYSDAKDQFAQLGVDTDRALERLRAISISLHCWQGDDVGGFEGRQGALDGGLAVTGNYPGKGPHGRRAAQRSWNVLCARFPGSHRVNLHAIYAETGGRAVERTDLEPKHFAGWIDWAKRQEFGARLQSDFLSRIRWRRAA